MTDSKNTIFVDTVNAHDEIDVLIKFAGWNVKKTRITPIDKVFGTTTDGSTFGFRLPEDREATAYPTSKGYAVKEFIRAMFGRSPKHKGDVSADVRYIRVAGVVGTTHNVRFTESATLPSHIPSMPQLRSIRSGRMINRPVIKSIYKVDGDALVRDTEMENVLSVNKARFIDFE